MAMNEESVNQLKQIEPHATNGISWKTVAIISLVVSGLLFLLILALIARRPMLPPQPLGPLPLEVAQPEIKQNAMTPVPTKQEAEKIDVFSFPSDAFFLREGEASVQSLSQNFDTYKELVELTLSGRRDKEERSYIITMPTFDDISEPKISFQEKYGCFSVSTSGYTGYYVFKIQDGKNIDTGKQNINCVTWIDDHRVIIAEKLYDTQEISFYILDAETNSKQVISTLT